VLSLNMAQLQLQQIQENEELRKKQSQDKRNG
jgi:hypothetical protein